MNKKSGQLVKQLFIIILIALNFIICQSPVNNKKNYQQKFTKRINSIPDFLQTDTSAEFPLKGEMFCAPVSVSNSFVWLSKNGFEKLMDCTGENKKNQIEMIKILSSKNYMNTSIKMGTGTPGLMEGIKKYLKDSGYNYKRLQYQGWRSHPKEFKTGVQIPKLNWIKQGVIGKGGVWANVGWYRYNNFKNEYTRIGGHWVTIVGYGIDETGNINPGILIIHDSALRAGNQFANEYVVVKQIKSGRLVGDKRYKRLPRSAKGYYILTGGMHIHRKADAAILDGVIVLEMEEVGS